MATLLNILVVEDNVTLYELVSRLLESTHLFTCKNSTTLKEVIEIIKNEKVDVIILDLYLPDSIDPVITVKTVRSMMPETPIVVLTGDTTINAGTLYLEGVQEVIFKNKLTLKMLIESILKSVFRHLSEIKFRSINETMGNIKINVKQLLEIDPEKF